MQRTLYIKNKARGIMQGVFYPDGTGGRRVRQKLATFAEVDLKPDGTPLVGRGRMTEERRARVLKKRHHAMAREMLLKRPAMATGVNLHKALQEWLGWAQTARAKGSVHLMRYAADSVMNSLSKGEQRRLSVDGFTLRHGDKWLEALGKSGIAPATINLRIRTINAFFGWAVERKLANQRLKIKRIKAQHKLPRVLTAQQEQALFERIARLSQTAGSEYRRRCYRAHLRMLAVSHFTGARRQEVFWLTWAQIDWEARCIFVRDHSGFTIKEGREKVLPMAPALLSFLQQERQANPAEVWLLDNGVGELLYTTPDSISLAMHRHFKAMGWEKSGVKPLAWATRGVRQPSLANRGRLNHRAARAWAFTDHRNAELPTQGHWSCPSGRRGPARRRACKNSRKNWQQNWQQTVVNASAPRTNPYKT